MSKNVKNENGSVPAEDERFLKLQKEAQAGDEESQKMLGEWYQEHEAYDKALEWYLKAAENDAYDVCWRIGDLYAEGLGVEKSLEKKAEWYIRGAEQGESFAQIELADMYFFGQGVNTVYRRSHRAAFFIPKNH